MRRFTQSSLPAEAQGLSNETDAVGPGLIQKLGNSLVTVSSGVGAARDLPPKIDVWKHLREFDFSTLARLVQEGSVYPNEMVHGCTLLYWSVSLGAEARVLTEVLLNLKADPNKPGVHGKIPLEVCLEKNNTEGMRLLLNNGADINAFTSTGVTIFISALLQKKTNVALNFLDHGVNMTLCDKDGWNGFHHAVHLGFYLVVDRIIFLFPSILCYNTTKGDSPIILACRSGKGMILKRLLNETHNKDDVSGQNWTALQECIISNNIECLMVLLEDGFDPNDGGVARIPPLFLVLQIVSNLSKSSQSARDPQASSSAQSSSSSAYSDTSDISAETPSSIPTPRSSSPGARETLDKLSIFVKMIEYLAKFKANVNMIALPTNVTPLLYAIENNLHTMVSSLIKYGASVRVATPLGLYPLHYACQIADVQSAQIILEYGFNVHTKNKEGKTALHIAIGPNTIEESSSFQTESPQLKEKRFEIVQLLMKYGSQPKIQIGSGACAIHLAIHNHHHEILEYMIKQDPSSAEVKRAPENRTALQDGICCGCIKCVEIILLINPSLDAEDVNGLTAPHQAVRMTHHIPNYVINQSSTNGTITPTISENGDYPSRIHILRLVTAYIQKKYLAGLKRSKSDENILRYAIRHRSVTATCILAREFDFVNKIGSDGNTPLHLACYSSDEELARILLESGADINILNGAGLSCLHVCVLEKKYNILRLLLEHTQSDGGRTRDGHSCFCLALQNGDQDCLELMFQEGVSFSPICLASQTPILHEAILRKSKPLVMTMLRYGVNTEITDKEGRSALHLAAWLGLRDICDALLKSGSDKNMQDKAKKCVLHYAIADMKSDLTKTIKDKCDLCIYLLASGCRWDLQDDKEHTIIHELIEFNRFETIERLSEYCDLAQYKGPKGLLQECVRHDRLDIAKFLVGIPHFDIDFVDGRDVTALQMAAAQGRANWVLFLLNFHASVDIENGLGERAIHFACMKGDHVITKMLLDYNSDPMRATKAGDTPISIAEDGIYLNCLKLLMERIESKKKGKPITVAHSIESDGHNTLSGSGSEDISHQDKQNTSQGPPSEEETSIGPIDKTNRKGRGRVSPRDFEGSPASDEVQNEQTQQDFPIQLLDLEGFMASPKPPLSLSSNDNRLSSEPGGKNLASESRERVSPSLSLSPTTNEISKVPRLPLHRLPEQTPSHVSIIHQPQQSALLRRKAFEGYQSQADSFDNGYWPDLTQRVLESALPPLDLSAVRNSYSSQTNGAMTLRERRDQNSIASETVGLQQGNNPPSKMRIKTDFGTNSSVILLGVSPRQKGVQEPFAVPNTASETSASSVVAISRPKPANQLPLLPETRATPISLPAIEPSRKQTRGTPRAIEQLTGLNLRAPLKTEQEAGSGATSSRHKALLERQSPTGTPRFKPRPPSSPQTTSLTNHVFTSPSKGQDIPG